MGDTESKAQHCFQKSFLRLVIIRLINTRSTCLYRTKTFVIFLSGLYKQIAAIVKLMKIIGSFRVRILENIDGSKVGEVKVCSI